MFQLCDLYLQQKSCFTNVNSILHTKRMSQKVYKQVRQKNLRFRLRSQTNPGSDLFRVYFTYTCHSKN